MNTQLDDRSTARCCRVLVVEDSPADAELATAYLDSSPLLDADVACATQLSEARTLLARRAFDVILLDMRLPDGTGIRLLRAVMSAAPTTPVVVLTGMTDASLAVEAMRTGAQDFLSKHEMTATSMARSVRYAIERREAEIALHESQKRESLGLLAGGIAHDFNNLLAAIQGYTVLAKERFEPSDPTHQDLSSIERAAERAAGLARQMLAYAGRGRFVVRRMNMNTIVSENLEFLRASISKGIDVQVDLCPYVPPVKADAGQIQQVIMNLLLNAAQAIGEETGSIQITTTTREIAPGDRVFSRFTGQPTAEGAYVSLSVRDTGCGMDDADIRQRFDPFVSTKGAGRGLGLSAVLGIVRTHGGGIHVESERGKGTCFEVLLPVTAGSIPTTPVPQKIATTWDCAGLTVLIVDDEPQVRAVAARMFEGFGMTAVTTDHGEAGLDMLEVLADTVDLVLLDYSMPGLNGLQIVERIRRQHSHMPIILASGYVDVPLGEAEGMVAVVLQKPYRPQELLAAVRTALA